MLRDFLERKGDASVSAWGLFPAVEFLAMLDGSEPEDQEQEEKGGRRKDWH